MTSNKSRKCYKIKLKILNINYGIVYTFIIIKILENWNLRECQALCEAKREEECVGIAYSHDLHYSHHCYLCFADILLVSDNEFGFYRRPGIFKIFSIVMP